MEKLKLKSIEKMKSVTKRMRWKALYFLNDDKDKADNRPETSGFKSRKIPPSCMEMERFKDFFNMITSIKFKLIKTDLQLELKEDVNKLENPKTCLYSLIKSTICMK